MLFRRLMNNVEKIACFLLIGKFLLLYSLSTFLSTQLIARFFTPMVAYFSHRLSRVKYLSN